MEKKFFTWEAFDEPGIFYDCILIQPIGQFAIGTKIPSITMNYDDGWIDIHVDDDNFYRFKLILSIGEAISQ